MGDVGMMPGLFMASASVVLSRFFVMTGRMFMVLGRLRVMFCALLAHRGFWRIEAQTDLCSSHIRLEYTDRVASKDHKSLHYFEKSYAKNDCGPCLESHCLANGSANCGDSAASATREAPPK
jgi:hypothetical protein